MKTPTATFAIVLLHDPLTQNAALRAGISVVTLWRWLKASTENPEAFTFDHGEWGRMPFHEAVRQAKQISVHMHAEEALQQSAKGFKRKAWFGGNPVWKVDPQLAADAQDPEVWKLMHGDKPITDIYARDEDGALIQAELEEAPNPVAALAILRANNPKKWSEHRSLDIQHGGGVMVVGGKPPPAAPQISAPVNAAIAHEVAAEIAAEIAPVERWPCRRDRRHRPER